MAEILTQREIDDLISQMADEAGNPLAAAGGLSMAAPRRNRDAMEEKRVRVYDFRRPDKFSKDQLRTLSMIHDNFARLLTGFFSATFRTMVSVTIASVDDLTYEEFTRGVHNPSVMGIFSLAPLKGNAIIDINPSIAFPMIDRTFGGPGQGLDKPRPLTEIETTVMERLTSGFLQSLAEAWVNIAKLTPQLEGVEANPMFAQIVAPNEIVIIVTLDCRIGENRGQMALCLPYILIEPILPKLSAHNWFSATQRDATPEILARLQVRLEEARVPFSVQLGDSQLSVRDLLSLEPGDVIVLDKRVSEDMVAFVGNKPKFWVQAGKMGSRMAIRLTGLLEHKEDDNE
ncbi:MAG: flagellar motor switch protein FliM [Firmicutes bacterium]|nr:flagellar motor switch protein FliM [Bacillota bacterium]